MLEQRECPKGGFRHKVLAQPWAERLTLQIFSSVAPDHCLIYIGVFIAPDHCLIPTVCIWQEPSWCN